MSSDSQSQVNARFIAFELLTSDPGVSAFVEDRLADAFDKHTIDQRDRRFVQNLVYGCIRNLSLLDFIIDRETNRKPPVGVVRVILRMGLYQLLFMDRVADHAAINETVECGRKAGLERQTGFFNGMLRNVLRSRDKYVSILAELADEAPWIRYSHPEWLYYKFCNSYGSDSVKKFMAGNNESARVFISPNLTKTDEKSLVRSLEQEGAFIELMPVPALKDKKFLRWVSGTPPQHTNAFAQGLFYIQDPSTHLAPSCVRAEAGEKVLDMCASPGGKSHLLAQMLDPEVRIDAADIGEKRLTLLNDNLRRLGLLDRVNVLPPDSFTPDYDWVLVDAPCSNSGVLNRRVDLRWRINEEDVDELCGLQVNLLDKAAGLLKPNGKIVFSTCSLDPDENEGSVRKFQAKHPEFTLLLQSKLCPWKDDVDGSFVACLKKNA